ncbi:MAG: sugar phosphate isomerase/epimerase [Chitinophagaceae bacterium]
MQLLFFCPRWGQDHLSWDVFLKKVKEAGYDGIEAGIPDDDREKDTMLSGLAKYGLQLIAQHWETTTPDFDTHLQQYEQRIARLASVNPLLINSQTGKDFFSFNQNTQLIKAAEHISTSTGVPVYHETHRGKFSFAAHVTYKYLEKLPTLQLTLDISHWFAVAESFLQDQYNTVETAIPRTLHIHARVGHTQGPQVSDPRAKEWEESLQHHLQCWDNIVAIQKKAGRKLLTITPEFGPLPYMPALPYTRQPIGNQWEINAYMRKLLKRRYGA